MRKGRIIAGIMAVVMALTMLPQSAVTALAAGPAVNKTIELGADILVNDDTTSSAPKKVKAGDELTYTGRLDVASIQEEIKSTASGYESYMSMISLSNVSSSFSTTLTVPSDGLVVDESKVSASLTDNNLFRIAETGGVSYNSAAGTITVNMELKNSYNSKTFKQLYDDVNACAKSLDVTIQGISVKNNAREGDKYTVSGTVSGGFSGTANVFVATKDFSFNWTGAQTADGRDSQITDPSSKDIQCTVEVDSTTPTPDPDPDHRPASWDISKSKVATNLNDDYESTITLSMPSAEENIATDVVLVLDASACAGQTLPAFINMLKELDSAQQSTGAAINLGIVVFKGNAVQFRQLSALTHDENVALQNQFQGFIDTGNIKSTISNYIKQNIDSAFQSSGTNIPSGLALARQMLDGDKSVADSRKYVALVSDGTTYMFCDADDQGNVQYSSTSDTVYTRASALVNGQNRYGSASGGTTEQDVHRGYTDYVKSQWAMPVWAFYFNTAGKAWLTDETAAKIDADGRLTEDGTKDDWMRWYTHIASNYSDFKSYDQYNYKVTNIYTLKDGDGTRYECKDLTDIVTGMDVSCYQAMRLYLGLESKYHTYFVGVEDPAGFGYGGKMFSSVAQNYINAGKGGSTNMFDAITKDILYLVGAGSSIEDYMGYVEDDYDFDFVNDADELSMKVGGKSYPAEKIADNKYGFDSQGDSYNYILEYTRGEGKDDEHFTWTTNVNVTNFAPVQIIYKVRLTNPKTAPGTYGVYDKDGSKGESGLYTNDRATLTIKDSSGNSRGTEAFSRPTVSYSVQAPSTPEEEHKRHHTDDTPATPETPVVTEIAEAGEQPIQIAESGTTEEPVTEISDKGAIGATGDDSMMALYGILVLAAGAVLITWAARRRRTR